MPQNYTVGSVPLCNWVKINESKFRLVEYKDLKGEDGQI